VNPFKYNYHLLDWEDYQHKMIYMIRNIYKVLKSQFMIVLAGEESYQYQIDKFGKTWDTENVNEEMIIDIIDHNKQKYTHNHNLINLPQDVFLRGRNMYFCAFEDFISDFDRSRSGLEEFIGVKITATEMPHMNDTHEWYGDNDELYQRNLALFNEWKDYLFEYCVVKSEWEKLSEYTEIDFVSKYSIQ